MNTWLFKSNSYSRAGAEQWMDSFRLPRWLECVIGIVIVMELIAPFVTSTYGSDGPYHLYWIQTYSDLLNKGIFPPRWLPSAFVGFGAPTFYFYPPLSYLFAAFVRTFIGNASASALFQIVCSFSLVIGSWGMWMLLRWLGSNRYRAILGVVVYGFAPYRVAEWFSRSSLSTVLGYAWIPFFTLGLLWILDRNSNHHLQGIILSAFSFGLVILSSVPLAIAIGIGCFIVLLVNYSILNGIECLSIIASLVLAVCLDAFFLLPAFYFRNKIHLTNAITLPEFAISDIFAGKGLPGVYHSILIYAAVIVTFVFWNLIRNKNLGSQAERRVIKSGFALCVAICFLDLPISIIVWKNVPLFPIIQGPWRFYILIVFLLAILVGIVQFPSSNRWIRNVMSIWFIGAIIPIVLILSDFHFYPHHITASLDPSEYLPAVARAEVFSSNDPERFLPALAMLSKEPIIGGSFGPVDSEFCKRISATPRNELYSIAFLKPHSVTFHRFDWSTWHLYAKDSEIPSRPDSLGRAVAVLPAGNYTAVWKLERTPLEVAGLWISGIAWSGVLLFSGISLVRKRVREK